MCRCEVRALCCALAAKLSMITQRSERIATQHGYSIYNLFALLIYCIHKLTHLTKELINKTHTFTPSPRDQTPHLGAHQARPAHHLFRINQLENIANPLIAKLCQTSRFREQVSRRRE
jgi:hypothetical protein